MKANIILALLIGLLAGIIIGERSQCTMLDGKYNWDNGQCIK